jgi:hypothetical protein
LRLVAVTIVLLIVVSVIGSPVSAADITIAIDKEQVHARIGLSLYQNMTIFPSEAVTLEGSRDPDLSSAIQDALKATNSSASFSTLSLSIASSASWLNLTLSMNLTGVSERRGDVVYANASWKDFRAQGDLRAGNLSYNTIGSEYLRPVLDFYENASRFEQNPNATVKAVTFFVNGTESVQGSVAANQVGNFTLLDFTYLSSPVEQWNREYSLSNNTTTWRYKPPISLNASVRIQELNKTFTIVSRYGFDAEITMTGLAVAQGNTLRVDVGNGNMEWIMSAIIVIGIALTIAVQMMFRRKRRAVRLGRR